MREDEIIPQLRAENEQLKQEIEFSMEKIRKTGCGGHFILWA
jgi:hypothetical protein